MIFQFRIISSESKDFARELLIDSNQTLLDFHQTLRANLGYGSNFTDTEEYQDE